MSTVGFLLYWSINNLIVIVYMMRSAMSKNSMYHYLVMNMSSYTA